MNTMTKMLKAKKNKKGFTLVELIVVLVILAILLAILVPSLVGWIGRARDKEVIVKGRNAYLAMETVLQENEVDTAATVYSGLVGSVNTLPANAAGTVSKTVSGTASFFEEAAYLANYPTGSNYQVKIIKIDNGSIVDMDFYDGIGKTAQLRTDPDTGVATWTVAKGAFPS